ncbi:hypothetical protein ACJROX_11505 [Pseudalkalibacillus sp. A8]
MSVGLCGGQAINFERFTEFLSVGLTGIHALLSIGFVILND